MCIIAYKFLSSILRLCKSLKKDILDHASFPFLCLPWLSAIYGFSTYAASLWNVDNTDVNQHNCKQDLYKNYRKKQQTRKKTAPELPKCSVQEYRSIVHCVAKYLERGCGGFLQIRPGCRRHASLSTLHNSTPLLLFPSCAFQYGHVRALGRPMGCTERK